MAIDEAQAILNQYFAALGGSLKAYMALGYRHMYGYGVPQSCVTSLRYFKYAADRTMMTAPAFSLPYRPTDLRLTVDRKFHQTFEQENQLEYFSTLDPASMGGMASIQAVAEILQNAGRASATQLQRAREILLQTAQHGHASALAYLGHMYAYGVGCGAELRLGDRVLQSRDRVWQWRSAERLGTAVHAWLGGLDGLRESL